MTTLVLLPCSLAALAAMGVGAAARSQTPSLVRVDGGELQGVVADGVVSFKGIPFAAPPVGELRWRPPQPAAKWTGVRQAAEFGADCMQGRFGPPPGAGARAGAPPAQGTATPAPAPPPPAAAPAVQAPSEDCLYLNVWRPADPAARNLPVMVWILRGRVHRRLELVAQHVGRRVRQAGRRPCRHELPRGALRLLRASGLEPRAPGREQGQLRLHGPDRRLAVGEAEHRRLRRQSEQRHDLRVFRGRRLRSQHAGVAAGARAVSQSHRRVRRLQGQRAHRPADE